MFIFSICEHVNKCWSVQRFRKKRLSIPVHCFTKLSVCKKYSFSFRFVWITITLEHTVGTGNLLVRILYDFLVCWVKVSIRIAIKISSKFYVLTSLGCAQTVVMRNDKQIIYHRQFVRVIRLTRANFYFSIFFK